MVTSTSELCSYAETKGGLRIILEIFDYDVDKKSLIGPAPLAARFAEEIRREHENFGLMVDLSHLPLLRESSAEAVIPVKDYLVHAHMGNAVVKDPGFDAYGDNHPRFGFPGGANDVDEVVEYLKVLLSIGFLNTDDPPVLSFEVKPWGEVGHTAPGWEHSAFQLDAGLWEGGALLFLGPFSGGRPFRTNPIGPGDRHPLQQGDHR